SNNPAINYPITRLSNYQIRRAVPRSDRALDCRGQARIDPVAGEGEAADAGFRGRPRRLARREREGRARFADDTCAHDVCGADRGHRLVELLLRELDQLVV